MSYCSHFNDLYHRICKKLSQVPNSTVLLSNDRLLRPIYHAIYIVLKGEMNLNLHMSFSWK